MGDGEGDGEGDEKKKLPETFDVIQAQIEYFLLPRSLQTAARISASEASSSSSSSAPVEEKLDCFLSCSATGLYFKNELCDYLCNSSHGGRAEKTHARYDHAIARVGDLGTLNEWGEELGKRNPVWEVEDIEEYKNGEKAFELGRRHRPLKPPPPSVTGARTTRGGMRGAAMEQGEAEMIRGKKPKTQK